MIDITQATLVLTILSILAALVILVGSLAFFGMFVQREYPPEAVRREEEPGVSPELRARRSAAYRLGIMVFIGLAVLTIIEYTLGVTWASAVLLLLIGLFKAGLIVQYFMHVSRLWSEEGH
jgi:cytochrome c oxidase subunit 4